MVIQHVCFYLPTCIPSSSTGVKLGKRGFCEMALVPFSYNNVFTDELRLEEKCVSVGSRFFRLKQGWKADGKGGSSIGFGASSYPGAFVLGWALRERAQHLLKGRNILELGCGIGLAAIMATAAVEVETDRPCLYVSTDGDQEVLQNLTASNIASNIHDTCNHDTIDHKVNREGSAAPAAGKGDEDGPSTAKIFFSRGSADALGEIVVQKLFWGDTLDLAAADTACAKDSKFHMVVAADIVAVPYAEAYGPLVETIAHFLQPNPDQDKGGTMNPLQEHTETVREYPWPKNASVFLLIYKQRHGSEAKFFHMMNKRFGEGCLLDADGMDGGWIHKDFDGQGMQAWAWWHR